MEPQIPILIAEDNDFRRRNLVSVLSQFPSLTVAAEARSGREVLELLCVVKAGVVLLDLEMPEMNGYEALGKISNDFPDVKVIVLSLHFDMLMAYELMMKGARACLPKNCGVEILIKTIMGVWENGYHFNEEVSQKLLQTSLNRMANDPFYLKSGRVR